MTNHRSSTTPLADDPMGSTEQHPLAETGQEVGASAGHLAERATEIGFQRADAGKDQVAEGIDQLAGSIRRVSTDMESEQPTIASAAMTAADQAERLAGYLRDSDARQILGTVEEVARRQPILFLGGAFLAGLAASRFLKAAGGSTAGRNATWGGSGYADGYRSGDGYSAGYRSGRTAAYQPTGPGGSLVGGGTVAGGTTDEGL